AVEWLRGVLMEYQRKPPASQSWEGYCGLLAAECLQVPWPAYRLPQTEDLTLEELGLFLLLADSGHVVGNAKAIANSQAFAALRVLDLAIEHQPKSGDVAAAGILYRTIRSCYHQFIHSEHARHWQLDRPNRDAAALVQNLFRRFPLVAHQLLKRHDSRA